MQETFAVLSRYADCMFRRMCRSLMQGQRRILSRSRMDWQEQSAEKNTQFQCADERRKWEASSALISLQSKPHSSSLVLWILLTTLLRPTNWYAGRQQQCVKQVSTLLLLSSGGSFAYASILVGCSSICKTTACMFSLQVYYFTQRICVPPAFLEMQATTCVAMHLRLQAAVRWSALLFDGTRSVMSVQLGGQLA